MYTLSYLAHVSVKRKMRLPGSSPDTRYCCSRAHRCSGPHWRASTSYSTVHSIPEKKHSGEWVRTPPHRPIQHALHVWLTHNPHEGVQTIVSKYFRKELITRTMIDSSLPCFSTKHALPWKGFSAKMSPYSLAAIPPLASSITFLILSLVL